MKNRIQVSPDIHFGKPCVAGTRITVQNVLELVREGIPFDAIIRNYYPDLKVEDIKACIQYAIDVVQTEDIHVRAPPREIPARPGRCIGMTFASGPLRSSLTQSDVMRKALFKAGRSGPRPARLPRVQPDSIHHRRR